MKIKLFGGLRRIAGAAEIIEAGSTIREGLQKACLDNDALEAALFDADTHELRPHVRVIVNGVDSELKGGLETPVADQDEIAVFPPIAGG